MSAINGFRRKTLKLPCRTATFAVNATVENYRLVRLLSIDRHKTVYLLEPQAVLCVRHNFYRLPQDLLDALTRGVPGLVRVLRAGTLDGYWYTIDEYLAPLPDCSSLSGPQRRQIVAGMAAAVNAMHDLGYCHVDIKLEHFRVDARGRVALIDLDSAARFSSGSHHTAPLEYTPEYAAPELFQGQFSTASDLYALGKSLAEWAGSFPAADSSGIPALASALTAAMPQNRYNYTQVRQYLAGEPVETATGPRTYSAGQTVGVQTAYSDRQLALYLSLHYTDAVHYVQSHTRLSRGEAAPARVAKLIHYLDRSLPLFWEGRPLASTQEIAAEMSRTFPRKNPSMVELLRSGVLLEFSQIVQADEALRAMLQSAVHQPESAYWQVSRAFGGRFATEAPVVSLTALSRKLSQLDSLLDSRLQHGDPAAVAAVLRTVNKRPDRGNIDVVIQQLQALPIDQQQTNLTNVTRDKAFGFSIHTTLPQPGQYPDDVELPALFEPGALYLVSGQSFRTWKDTNREQKAARRKRNIAILKAAGWAAAAVAILALLPYILKLLLILGILWILFQILL